jgi:hypothetical protein
LLYVSTYNGAAALDEDADAIHIIDPSTGFVLRTLNSGSWAGAGASNDFEAAVFTFRSDPILTAASDESNVEVTVDGDRLHLDPLNTPDGPFTGSIEITVTARDGSLSAGDSRGRSTTQTIDVHVGTGAIYGRLTGQPIGQANNQPLEGWTVFIDHDGDRQIDDSPTQLAPFVGEVDATTFETGQIIEDTSGIARLRVDGTQSDPPAVHSGPIPTRCEWFSPVRSAKFH